MMQELQSISKKICTQINRKPLDKGSKTVAYDSEGKLFLANSNNKKNFSWVK